MSGPLNASGGARRTAGHGLVTGTAIRTAGSFDVPAIAALHARCFADGLGGTPWSATAIGTIFEMPGTYGLLAGSAVDPAPLGFALGRSAADEAEILSLGVLPAARRGGVGRALLGAVLARAAGTGARRLYLEVAEDNLAARRLYAGAGFTLVGRRPGYYQRPGGPAAALVFARDLGPSGA